MGALLGASADAAEEVARRFGSRRDEPMVDLAVACPGVAIELRYATLRNVTGACIYSPDARPLLRQSVAARVNRAQESLEGRGVRLKIWDAYRPAWAQRVLWQAIQNPEVIGNPDRGGSLHTWGACVDVTLVDKYGRELRMPTDFDKFTADAASTYRGNDRGVAANLKLLQGAMAKAGFIKMRDEWWHFTAPDAMAFAAVTIDLAKAKPPTRRTAQRNGVVKAPRRTRTEAVARGFQFRTRELDLRTAAAP